MRNSRKVERIKHLIINPSKDKKVFEYKDNVFYELKSGKGFIKTDNRPQEGDTVICINNPEIKFQKGVLVWHETKTY